MDKEKSTEKIDELLDHLDSVEDSLFEEDCNNRKNTYNEMNCYLQKETVIHVNELYQCNLLVSLIGNNGNDIHSDSIDSSDSDCHDNTSFNSSSEFDSENDVLLIVDSNDVLDEKISNDVLKQEKIIGTPSNFVSSNE